MGCREARDPASLGRAALRHFARFAAIDWSGAVGERPAGLALAVAEQGDAAPALLPAPHRRWSRADLLAWLQDHARDDLLIGVDFSLALPFADAGAYFPGWPATPPDARALWALVDETCAADPHLAATALLAQAEVAAHFLQPGRRGHAYAPASGRLRRCEARAASVGLRPGSSLKLIGPNQVGKASLTGMRVLHRLTGALAIWPLDPQPATGATLVEIYTGLAAVAAGRRAGAAKMRTGEALDDALAHPAIASRPTELTGPLDDHSTDALLTAAWLRRAAGDVTLWQPEGLDTVALTEGWTFGVR